MDSTVASSAEMRRGIRDCCDVLVIGGGPAGTTIATLLKQKGWNIVLLEQEFHPRFHIGESLLPMNLPIMERLEVLDQVRRIGITKYAAEFSPGDAGAQPQAIYFADAVDKNHPYAFQVRRSEFDEILFRNCADKGVAVYEGVKVKNVEFRSDQKHLAHTVDAQGNERTWGARFLVDASGRDTFLSRKNGTKQKNAKHQSAAIFGHFENVARRAGRDEGNISIYWFDHGWFWMIPLRGNVMSVGAVCWPEYLKSRRTSAEDLLWQTIKLCPQVSERMQSARLLGRARATGNYSYRSSRMYGDGYILVGDAFAFIDPVFSTGVYLAMNSAVLGSEAVDAHLRDPRSSHRAFHHFERQVRHGIDTVSWFIYRFTAPAMQELFMAPRNAFRIQEAIISLLAGDVFRRTPIGIPLAVFKVIYYWTSVARLSRSWASYARRKHNVALAFDGGTTAQDEP
ncbi:MAG: NAD(P)/FAD-dependent oxidoreductase [Hyphomicrobium sp.]